MPVLIFEKERWCLMREENGGGGGGCGEGVFRTATCTLCFSVCEVFV
jgi:hypothetical protein